MKHILFIGRWSPFHQGHKYIIDAMLNSGHAVAIGVRDSDDKYSQRARAFAIEKVYAEEVEAGTVKIVLLPDVEMVCVSRGVGYGVVQVPDTIEQISGTGIRAGDLSGEIPEVMEMLARYPTITEG